MSTKAIRETLNQCAAEWADSEEFMMLLASANEELEAIERAAKAMDDWNRDGQKRLDPDMARAWRLVESIAKDAP